jgi:hypothetical protein
VTARRLLLSTTDLELVRRQALPPPLVLPPGFGLEPTGTGSQDAAWDRLRETGVVARDGAVHPAVADDLRVLAAPELAVTVRARVPGLEVHACLALSGPRGAGLLRTGDTAVELSAFRASSLPGELARVVPAPERSGAPAEQVPLEVLLDAAGSRLHGRVTGTLHATVLAGPREGRAGGVVGSLEWVWDGAWTGLEARPSRAGRPQVGLVPVGPLDLAGWVAPLLAGAAA